jgi:hypothetical protein
MEQILGYTTGDCGLGRSPISLLRWSPKMQWFIALAFGLIIAPSLTFASEPSRAQCECRPLAGEREKANYFSTIDNASLCVNVGSNNAHPMCRVKVYCLSDGTGPGCKQHPQLRDLPSKIASGSENEARDFTNGATTLLDDFLKTTSFKPPFAPADISALLTSQADQVRKCMSNYLAGRTETIGKPFADKVVCKSDKATSSLAIVVFLNNGWFAYEFATLRR